MKMFEFKLAEGTDVGGFLDMIRQKYSSIVNRKRLCCYEGERTPELIADCTKFGVVLTEVIRHTKDCELGDNWKDCPACVEAKLDS